MRSTSQARVPWRAHVIFRIRINPHKVAPQAEPLRGSCFDAATPGLVRFWGMPQRWREGRDTAVTELTCPGKSCWSILHASISSTNEASSPKGSCNPISKTKKVRSSPSLTHLAKTIEKETLRESLTSQARGPRRMRTSLQWSFQLGAPTCSIPGVPRNGPSFCHSINSRNGAGISGNGRFNGKMWTRSTKRSQKRSQVFFVKWKRTCFIGVSGMSIPRIRSQIRCGKHFRVDGVLLNPISYQSWKLTWILTFACHLENIKIIFWDCGGNVVPIVLHGENIQEEAIRIASQRSGSKK